MSWEFYREAHSKEHASILVQPPYQARVYLNDPIPGLETRNDPTGGTGILVNPDWGWTVTKLGGTFSNGQAAMHGNSATEDQAKIDVYRLLNDDCPNNAGLLDAWTKLGFVDSAVVDNPDPLAH